MREKYIKMRQSGSYDAAFFYTYFLENGGSSVSIDTFIQVLNMHGLDGIIEFLDKKFEVVKVEDKNGKLLKIF